MEIFLLIVVIALVLVMISNLRGDVNNRFDALQKRLDALLEEQRKAQREKPRPEEVEKRSWEAQHKTPVVVPEIVKPEKKLVPEIKPEEVKKPEPVIIPRVITPPQEIKREPVAIKAPEPPKPGFFERNPDLEKFIGENLANKIGIGVLVLGIGFFVKYAIDQEWINEIGRVFIGILCGGILLGVAHRLRNSFRAFSSVLVGGGIAVLYLTIAIAFHEYKIFNQTSALLSCSL